MTALFVITTRGLEAVAAAEITSLGGFEVTGQGYRRVALAGAGTLAPLLALRTVDDCFLELATWAGISHMRSALEDLAQRSRALDLRGPVEQLRRLRTLSAQPSFAVTVNFVGKRNYSGDEARQRIGDALRDRMGWVHQPRDDAAEINVRAFIEHETVHVGLRLGEHPLHERSYPREHRPGALRPPVAAAMVALGQVRPRQQVVDPCCGAGAIVIEAVRCGARAQAGDLDGGAVAAARANALHAGVAAGIARWDACALPLPDASCDHIIGNLPWDRQVGIDSGLQSFHERACAEIDRVLRPGGTATLLTIHAELVRLPGRTRVREVEISLNGQLPRIICER